MTARRLYEIVTVSEEAILRSMRMVWETMKIVIEPSAAVPVAALLEKKIPAAGRVGVILSGGNVDLDSVLAGWSGSREPRSQGADGR